MYLIWFNTRTATKSTMRTRVTSRMKTLCFKTILSTKTLSRYSPRPRWNRAWLQIAGTTSREAIPTSERSAIRACSMKTIIQRAALRDRATKAVGTASTLLLALQSARASLQTICRQGPWWTSTERKVWDLKRLTNKLSRPTALRIWKTICRQPTIKWTVTRT